MIEIFGNAQELARGAAEYFVARSGEMVARKGYFTVALSGGSTPKILYELLANPDEPFYAQVPWSRTHFFWSDERLVPPDHPDSNYRMAYEAMLSRVPVPASNIYRMRGEYPNADAAAAEYEKTFVHFSKTPDLTQLDLILLGLGPDGHTASIFPGSDVLQEKRRLFAAPWVEKLNTYRITMTLPLLNDGGAVLFLVSGAEKAEIVKKVLEGPKLYPAQYVQPTHGQLLWMLDKDAADERR